LVPVVSILIWFGVFKGDLSTRRDSIGKVHDEPGRRWLALNKHNMSRGDQDGASAPTAHHPHPRPYIKGIWHLIVGEINTCLLLLRAGTMYDTILMPLHQAFHWTVPLVFTALARERMI